MHELGHNLGLSHGGNDHQNYKPNYLSVMNYHFQSGFFREFIKPSQCGNVAPPCAVQGNDWDYSTFLGNQLNEKKLKESVGVVAPGPIAARYVSLQVCGSATYYIHFNKPVNWNCNGSFDSGAVKADINGDGQLTDLGKGQDNWANIIFDGGAIPGTSVYTSQIVDPSTELDWELHETLPTIVPLR